MPSIGSPMTAAADDDEDDIASPLVLPLFTASIDAIAAAVDTVFA